MSEQIKHKMQNLEMAPPPGAWDFIATQLDKTVNTGNALVQQKMNSLTAEPPVFIWKEIEKELDKNAEKVISVNHSKKAIYLRYAAAAVFIGLIATGISLFFNNNQKNLPSTLKNEQIAKTGNNNNQIVVPSGNQPAQTLPDTEETKSTSTTNSSSTPYTSSRLPLEKQNTAGYNDALAMNEFSLQKTGADEVSYENLDNPSEGIRMVARSLKTDIPDGINALTANDNYFITSGPNGEVVRASNKLSNIIPLLSDDNVTQEYLDVAIRESVIWKQRYDNLRNKLSKITPSPNNFLDIIQLTDALKEDKKP
ncbi:MAG: hypothetical protein ACM3H8_07055 [Sphingobacteriales bacterium]